MTTEAIRMRSHADVRATLLRVGVEPERIDRMLADYPDPFDLNGAEAAFMADYGITQGALMEEMGGSP